MSKQSDSKTRQGYEPKPIFPMCGNCKHFRSEKITNKYYYEEEKNIRCGIGEFAVKKQGTCRLHEIMTYHKT